MYNNVYANCVGYAFEQCYSSSIEITYKIKNDEQHLQMLKELVAEYEQACEIVKDESKLMWSISKELIAKVKSAKCLADVY